MYFFLLKMYFMISFVYKLLFLILILISMNISSSQLDDPDTWRPITDQVMGGISNLSITHSDGVFAMTGEVSTENNGGFVRLSNRININNNDFKGIKFKASKGAPVFLDRDELLKFFRGSTKYLRYT